MTVAQTALDEMPLLIEAAESLGETRSSIQSSGWILMIGSTRPRPILEQGIADLKACRRVVAVGRGQGSRND